MLTVTKNLQSPGLVNAHFQTIGQRLGNSPILLQHGPSTVYFGVSPFPGFPVLLT